MKVRLFLGISIMIIAYAFGYAETAYFGWNLFPKTWAEIMCDTISAMLCLIGIFLFITGFSYQIEKYINE